MGECQEDVPPTLKLNQADREKLELIAPLPKTSQRAAQRAGIILACAQGMNNGQVAAASRVSAPLSQRLAAAESLYRG